MKKNLHDIDKLFKDALDDHLEPAPSSVWDGVSNDLDKKQAFLYKEKYDRLKKMALVLLLFVFAATASLFYFNTTGKKNTAITKQENAKMQEERLPGVESSPVQNSSEKEVVINKGAQPKEQGNTAQPVSPTGELTEAAKQDEAKEKIPGKNNAGVKKENKIKRGLQPAVRMNDEAVAAINNSGNADRNGNEIKISKKKKNSEKNNFPVVSYKNGKYLPSSKGSMQSAANDHELQIAAAKKEKNSKAFSETVKNDYPEVQINQPGAGNSSLNLQAAKRKINTLAPYLYQASLITSLAGIITPGPFIAIDSTSFINEVAKNMGPPKAVKKIKATSKHAVSLTAFASPNHSFTRLENDNLRTGPGRGKDIARKEEQQGSSFSAGLLVNYGLSKNIILQSGIVFSSAKTNISPKTIYARPDNNGLTRYEFNCSSGYSYIDAKSGVTPAVGDSIKVMGSNSSISYIGIPLSLNYVWQKGRFLLKPGIGMSINFLTNGKSATRLSATGNQKDITATITGLRAAYLDASIGLGAEWMLSKRIAIGVRPLLRMALTSINKNTPVRAYQNFMSLETGLRINL